MQLFSAEYRFPIIKVERSFMAPPLGLKQLSCTLFYEGGNAWNDDKFPSNYLTSAGLELNFDTFLFYIVNVNIRVGFAQGFDEGGEGRYYLSLGSTF